MIERAVINRWCRNNRCGPTFYGDNPSIVILGESHYNQRHHQQEESMIQLAGPEYLLHELFDGRIYDPTTAEVRYLPGVLTDAEGPEAATIESHIEDRLVNWADKYRCLLVGMDLTFYELDVLGEMIPAKHPDYELSSVSSLECKHREKRMGERMAEYHRKTDKPILAIMGSHHRKPKSEIHPILQTKGISYVCIRLSD